MSDAIRQNGTILFSIEAPEDQSRWFYEQRKGIDAWRTLSPLQGVLRADNGWIYGWREGHSYRDFTTPDKLQPGCRVAFEVSAHDPALATGLSWHLV